MEPISRAAMAMGLVVLVSVSAGAARQDHPILVGGASTDLGWASITLTTDGDAAITEVFARSIGDAVVATYVFEGDRLRYGALFVSLDAPTSATITEIGLPGFAAYDERSAEAAVRQGDLGLFLTLNDPMLPSPPAPKVGTFRILLFAAGNAASWEWDVRGGPGTVIQAIEQGSGTFLHGARDFRGALHVERGDGEMAARTQAANELLVPIEDAFLGAAYTLNGKAACADPVCYGAPTTDVLTLQRPDAAEPTRCFCTLHRAAPGMYAFQLTGADAWLADEPAGLRLADDMVVIAGADARLP